MKILTTIAAATVAIGISGAAFAQQGGMSPDMQKMMTEMTPKPEDAPSTRDFKEADMKMMHDMPAPFTGDADVDFRTHMIPHHQGAVDMAKVALKYAKDPATKKLARKIVSSQEKEIGEMQAWLKKHGH